MSSNEYMAVYMLRRYRERMAYAINTLGGKCVRCNSIEQLQLDHIDPKTKLFTIGNLWNVAKVRFEAELQKCQILCKACHERKTLFEILERTPRSAHGTENRYQKYRCRCAACKSYMKTLRYKRRNPVGH